MLFSVQISGVWIDKQPRFLCSPADLPEPKRSQTGWLLKRCERTQEHAESNVFNSNYSVMTRRAAASSGWRSCLPLMADRMILWCRGDRQGQRDVCSVAWFCCDWCLSSVALLNKQVNVYSFSVWKSDMWAVIWHSSSSGGDSVMMTHTAFGMNHKLCQKKLEAWWFCNFTDSSVKQDAENIQVRTIRCDKEVDSADTDKILQIYNGPYLNKSFSFFTSSYLGIVCTFSACLFIVAILFLAFHSFCI